MRGEMLWVVRRFLPSSQVSLEEAIAYLDNEESVDLPTFMERVWSFVSDKITFDLPETETETVVATPPPTEAPPPRDTPDDEEFEDYDDYGVCVFVWMW